jgi:putative membrane protein
MKRVIIFLSLLLTACNSNTSTPDNGLTQDRLITEGDNHKFLAMAAEGSMTELASGRFASGHATDQRLKDYGYEMIKDHGNLLGQLKQMALLRNITLPDTVNNSHQQLLGVLRAKAGNSFDSTYMAEIISHQKKLIHLYDKIQTSPDTALQSYAIKTLPVITNHLLHLITIRDSINIEKE